ncbi:MAG: S-layer homology domain-containing protein, partial [Oscillospiraceae bacterium]|nr:S-layer homology domain-containing protein [Oscillospiraceae bacterium]
QTQIAALKAEALAEKDSWMDTAGGTDGLTPIMLALAPYYSEDDVKEALDAAVEAVKAAQAEDGAIGGNAASTGLALAGLAAMNIDPADVKAGEGEDAKSLTDGIMTFAGDDGASIGSNGFDMEQGFRGLVALAKLGSGIYDFSGNIGSRVPAVATPAKAVVTFSVVPSSAEITVLLNGEEEAEPSATSDKTYSLDAGSYTYTVEKEGYTSESGEITITEEQADAAEEITIKINLSVIEDEEAQLVTITVKVMVHDAETCENALTYKNDADKYFSLLGDEESCEITLNAEDATAADALLAALIEFDIEYEQQSNGYFPSIGGYAEKEHGAKSGWMYMVDGTPADVAATEYKFTKDSTMVWFYTDDYTKDYGSEAFGGDDDEPATSGETAEKPVFEDVPEDAYYAEAVDWAVENGITTGTSETTFSPDDDCTRAQMVTFLWRAAGSPAPSVTETAFTDIDSGEYYYQAVLWAVENGITTGTTETTFSPNDTVTRAQAVTFIYRYAGSPAVEKTDVFTDVDPDSYYADAVSWAYGESVTTGTSETTFSPEEACLRAQIVTFLYRYFAD